MIKKFEQYNESVRDFMKPKSVDDIIKNFDTNPKSVSDMFDRIPIEEQDQFYSALYKSTPMNKVNDIFLEYIYKNRKNLTRHTDNKTLNKINNVLTDLLPYVETEDALKELSMSMYEEMNDEQVKNAINMFVKQYEQNESVRDFLKPKSRKDIEANLKDILSKVKPGKELGAKFFYGCEQGILWLVEEALAEGADINDEYGYLLVVAAHSGSAEVVEYLLNNDISTRYITDAIDVALSAGKKETYEILIEFEYNKEIEKYDKEL